MRGVLGGLLLVTAAASVGCGENCQSACGKIYDPSECGVQIGGVTSAELTRDCVNQCKDALDNTGPMGNYNPTTRRDPLDPKTIENEKQAAAWMDCVAAATCEDLEPATGGLCEH